jgi:hypothetical protein
MSTSIIMQAIRDNPKILWQIAKLPELNTRGLSGLEVDVFNKIEHEAFSKRRFFANSSHMDYHRNLSQMQRDLLRLERDYLVNRPALRHHALYVELARVYNGLKGANITAQQVRQELELGTEILKSIEAKNYLVDLLAKHFRDES